MNSDNNIHEYDKIIIGGGLYGLYAAFVCAHNGSRVAVLEKEKEPFKRATYINQARVHMGYHYPRSVSTASKSFHYFERFFLDFKDCILADFEQIYAVSSEFSYTNGMQFKKFCDSVGIFCEEVPKGKYFKENRVEAAFRTREYTYDARLLLHKLMAAIEADTRITLITNAKISMIKETSNDYIIATENHKFRSNFILNASYASTNQLLQMLGYEKFDIKYELCEIILCNVNSALKKVGITVMDGPFFSIMPFGKTGKHSLTSVSFTPHITCYKHLPSFECQSRAAGTYCSPLNLGNCNECEFRPQTAWAYMSKLCEKYMDNNYQFIYDNSLFSMKPILKSSEIDDSRPTVIKVNHKKPAFISVLSGKINTVYDLEEIIAEYE